MRFYVPTESGREGPYSSQELYDKVIDGELTLDDCVSDAHGADLTVSDALDREEEATASFSNEVSDDEKFATSVKAVIKLMLIGVVAIGAIYVRSCREESDSAAIEAEAKQLVANIPGYEDNRDYYDFMVERYHPDAFEAAYERSRRKTTFDETKYVTTLIAKMAGHAGRDNRRDISILLNIALQGMRTADIPRR